MKATFKVMVNGVERIMVMDEQKLAREVGKEVRRARSRESVVLLLIILGAVAFLLYSCAR